MLCACAPRIVRPPIDFGVRGRIDDPAALLALVEAGEARLESVGGEAKLSLESPEGDGKVTAMVAARRPATFRVDLVSPFGPLSTVASDGAVLTMLDFQQEVALEGPVQAGGLDAVLPVQVPTDELVTLLLGDVPLSGVRPGRLEVDAERGAYLLTLLHPEGNRLLWVDPATLRPVRWVVPPSAVRDGLSVEWRDHEEEAPRLARKLRIASLDGRRSLELRWRDRAANEPFEEALFRPEVPKGFARRRLPR
jgi:hypothetical protein